MQGDREGVAVSQLAQTQVFVPSALGYDQRCRESIEAAATLRGLSGR
jgi:hypothetical protein